MRSATLDLKAPWEAETPKLSGRFRNYAAVGGVWTHLPGGGEIRRTTSPAWFAATRPRASRAVPPRPATRQPSTYLGNRPPRHAAKYGETFEADGLRLSLSEDVAHALSKSVDVAPCGAQTLANQRQVMPLRSLMTRCQTARCFDPASCFSRSGDCRTPDRSLGLIGASSDRARSGDRGSSRRLEASRSSTPSPVR
jgi:hypothetical protein